MGSVISKGHASKEQIAFVPAPVSLSTFLAFGATFRILVFIGLTLEENPAGEMDLSESMNIYQQIKKPIASYLDQMGVPEALHGYYATNRLDGTLSPEIRGS